ncbi:MAG: OB-fold nucleic acid binding domain-containing protein, partial [Candidatus Omnitrophica bacterium]|nr:OB-fold nucleic acid binding domain-containing protein [Candidatus Omnitrophota bacterium]
MRTKELSELPIQYLKGIGPKKAKLFHKLGIYTIEDLFYFLPRRYEDRRSFVSVSKLRPDEFATIKVEVLARGKRTAFKNKRVEILEVVVADQTGKIFCVWFNQGYLFDYFKVGQRLILYGKPQAYQSRLQLVNPEFELIEEEKESSMLNIGRNTPIYNLCEGITQRSFRQILK